MKKRTGLLGELMDNALRERGIDPEEVEKKGLIKEEVLARAYPDYAKMLTTLVGGTAPPLPSDTEIEKQMNGQNEGLNELNKILHEEMPMMHHDNSLDGLIHEMSSKPYKNLTSELQAVLNVTLKEIKNLAKKNEFEEIVDIWEIVCKIVIKKSSTSETSAAEIDLYLQWAKVILEVIDKLAFEGIKEKPHLKTRMKKALKEYINSFRNAVDICGLGDVLTIAVAAALDNKRFARDFYERLN